MVETQESQEMVTDDQSHPVAESSAAGKEFNFLISYKSMNWSHARESGCNHIKIGKDF